MRAEARLRSSNVRMRRQHDQRGDQRQRRGKGEQDPQAEQSPMRRYRERAEGQGRVGIGQQDGARRAAVEKSRLPAFVRLTRLAGTGDHVDGARDAHSEQNRYHDHVGEIEREAEKGRPGDGPKARQHEWGQDQNHIRQAASHHGDDRDDGDGRYERRPAQTTGARPSRPRQ